MKNNSILAFFIIMIFTSLFTSCKKDNDNTPTVTEAPALYKTVVGKWKITSLSGRAQQTNISSKIQDVGDLTSIEFLSDSSYIITTEDDIYTGSFKVTDSTSITLTNFGALSEIKVTADKMNFKLSYQQGGSITISANKAAEIPLTDNTKLLCRRWVLTNQESGAEIYEDSDGADKITLLFSSAGTYLVQFLRKDSVLSADISNWQWHPTEANTILYWWDDEEDDKSPLIVKELTANSLKLTETYTGDSGETITITYVMAPTGYSGRVAHPTNKISKRTELNKKSIFRTR